MKQRARGCGRRVHLRAVLRQGTLVRADKDALEVRIVAVFKFSRKA